MSKKIASSVDAILLDVKVGNGAFMKNLEDARELAELMVNIAELAGLRAIAVLSDMNQPLGDAVGNSLELIEAIDTLKGGGPADFVAHCEEISAQMLILGNIVDDKAEALNLVRKHLQNGDAFRKFVQMVDYQGGDVSSVEKTIKLPKAPNRELVLADRSGYIEQIHARTVGECAVILGAGRQKKSDSIDYGVGILTRKRVGQTVEQGEELFTIFGNRKTDIQEAADLLVSAVKIVDEPIEPLPHFYEVIE
jgi:pyrimidine-nucleoside phosphorylase